MAKSKSKSFKAPLERLPGGLGWVIARIPFDAAAQFGSRRPKVKGEINGFAFRTSLFPARAGGHFLLVNKHMQRGGGAAPGCVATIRLEVDVEKREISPPAELKRILSDDRELRKWYDALNYSTRKYIADWITDVKSREARVRRSEQLAERLLATMEAEHELPALIQREFARVPYALEGWKLMSPTQRRGQLLAIFYYRDPGSRLQRIIKTAEAAAEYAEKKR